jgi:hypothetical protein
MIVAFAIALIGPLFVHTDGEQYKHAYSTARPTKPWVRVMVYWLHIFFSGLAALTVAAILILFLYKDHLRKNLGQEKTAIRIKLLSHIFYYVLIIAVIAQSITLALRLFGLLTMKNIQVAFLFRSHVIWSF